MFRADLAAAQTIALRRGVKLKSLVLPRNQWNLRLRRSRFLDLGFPLHHAARNGHGATEHVQTGGSQRAATWRPRLAETYIGRLTSAHDGSGATSSFPSGLCNVPASAFLRPYAPDRKRLETLRLARLRSGLRDAARHGRIFHLWWHPHTFSQHGSENFASPRKQILDLNSERLAAYTDGMQSLSMADVAAMVASEATRTRDSG